MLGLARKRLGELADLQLCSAVNLPYRNNSFDLVMASYTLHEMPYKDRVSVVAEMARVLKPSGRILLTDFLSGPHDFPMRWVDSAFIYLYERMAGGEHFRNSRDFLRRGGLQGLVASSSLEVGRWFFPKGRAVALFLLRKERRKE
jgi:ubiquinone/menaquinone biosynthesis C-methylase UbiE